jgi:hypothetical protein
MPTIKKGLYIRYRADEDDRRKLNELCKERKVGMSELLRELVNAAHGKTFVVRGKQRNSVTFKD